ncbi:hypothetical protein Dimus_029372, partial [Dionaea muscipula]
MAKKAAEEILGGATTDSKATHDEASEEVVKDVASPQQTKRKLTKGGFVATGAEVVAADKGKQATTATAVVPMAEGQDKAIAEKEGRKTKAKGKVDEAKSRK